MYPAGRNETRRGEGKLKCDAGVAPMSRVEINKTMSRSVTKHAIGCVSCGKRRCVDGTFQDNWHRSDNLHSTCIS